MLQILIPALLGAHSAKKKGGSALKGAVLGGLFGGMLPVASTATTTTGAKLAGSKGLESALATAKSGSVPIVEQSITTAGKKVASTLPSATEQVARFNTNLLSNQSKILQQVQQSEGKMTLSPDSIAQLNTNPVGTARGVNATQQALNTYNKNVMNSITGPTGGVQKPFDPTTSTRDSLLQTANDRRLTAKTLDKTLMDSAKSIRGSEPNIVDKIKTTAKEKPLETAMAASMLMGGEEGGGAAPVGGAGLSMAQPGGFGDVPSVEQSIAGQVNQPTFIPKGLFEETKNTMRSREEEMMMMKYLNSRGLV